MPTRPTYEELQEKIRILEQSVAEQKQTVAALKRSEERLKILTNASFEAIFLSENGICIDQNPAAEKMFGYTHSEAVGRHGSEWIAPADREFVRNNMLKDYAEAYEATALRKNGSTFSCEIQGQNVNYAGRVIRRTALRDITARKQTEKALLESRAELSQANQMLIGILGHTPILAAFLDPQFNFVWVNRAYANAGKHPPSFFIGKNHFDLYPHEENQRIFQKVVETGDPYFAVAKPFEYPDQPQREATYWDWSLIPIKDASQKIMGLVFTLSEMTERIRAEEALRRSEVRFRLLFQTSPDSAIVTRLEDGMCVAVNEAFTNLMGYKREEVLGKTLASLNAWKNPDDRIRFVKELKEKGHVEGFEAQFVTKEGRIRDGSISAGILRMENEDYALSITRDDTERKQSQDALKKARDELEFRVKERTAELVEYAAKLEKLNKELQEFTFAASHDLQEPLRKIQVFGKMLSNRYWESIDDRGQDYISRLTDAAERMSSLLQSLLQYSRLTTRKESFELVELEKIVEDAILDLEIHIQESGIKVESGRLPAIEADPHQMRQLFQNLIGNAIKYRNQDAEEQMVKINGISDCAKCQIFVEDNGIGFNEQYLNKIFLPFQRLHDRESPYKGTGMGLAICRKIVERHGGSISAKSTPGCGSTFIISLPMKQNGTNEGFSIT